MLGDRLIDAVCIATPDHWHAHMTVEACKAGKDVYVEKPLCAGVNEGLKMVEAARKHNRIVEAGTWQRSMSHFLEAVELVRTGKLGKIFQIRTFNYFFKPAAGDGNPPDSDPPPGIDWDMWLTRPARPYNSAQPLLDPTANTGMTTREEETRQFLNRSYISCNVIVRGTKRFQEPREHEIYNMGHLITAGVVHCRMTGKDSLLRVARRAADFLCATSASR